MIRIEKWLEFIAEADGEILGKGKGVTVVKYPFIDFEGVIAITAGQRKSVVIAAFDGVCIDGTVGNGDLGLGFLGAACVADHHIPIGNVGGVNGNTVITIACLTGCGGNKGGIGIGTLLAGTVCI